MMMVQALVTLSLVKTLSVKLSMTLLYMVT